MSNNILFISPQQYFSELVENGLQKKKVNAIPAVKAYLVNLLENYLDAKKLFEDEVDEQGNKSPSTLAELYLKANNSESKEKRELLKKLGDKSLYISGFFGSSLTRKLVDIDYYAGMGCTAYENLSYHVKEDTQSKVYKIFSKNFLEFVDVLSYISEDTFIQGDHNILSLYERYLKTGSESAKEKLIEMGVVTLSKDHIKLVRQD
jgi:hypothetical protein